MGRKARKKSTRKAQKSRQSKNPPPSGAHPAGNLTPTTPSSSATSTSSPDHPKSPSPNPNPNPNPNPDDVNDLSETQIQELLFKKLDLIYNEAFANLISFGHDESLVLQSLLVTGHFYGPSTEPHTNVLLHATAYLTSCPHHESEYPPVFSDLRRLQEQHINVAVTVLLRCRPKLTRQQAFWCLLTSDLRLGLACVLSLPGGEDDDDVDRIRSMNNSEFLSLLINSRSDSQDSQESGSVDSTVKILDKSLKEMAECHEICVVASTLMSLKGMNIDEWAQENAIQAARKLSNDLNELTVLTMESKEKDEAVEEVDVGVKRPKEMVSEMEKLSEEDDWLLRRVEVLEKDNAEIRAELEAEKLNASELEMKLMEVAKWEKKYQKRILAWQKQREKHEQGVAEVRKEIVEIQKELDRVKKAQKETEVKLREEQRAREESIALVEEERRAKEAADVSIKRKHEALYRKIELDFQHHEDDIQKLEELFCLQALAGLTELNPSSSNLWSGVTDMTKLLKYASGKKFGELNEPQGSPLKEVQRDRKCIICMKDEVSVVFLPCAHQILCTSCNYKHEMWAKGICPHCFFQIEQRIQVRWCELLDSV